MPPDFSKKIELASRIRLAHVEELAPRFFREVVGHEYVDCLVTDESDLLDFAAVSQDRDAAVAMMLDRLEAHYLVDGRAIGSTRIVDLLELLASKDVVS